MVAEFREVIYARVSKKTKKALLKYLKENEFKNLSEALRFIIEDYLEIEK